MSVEAKSKRDLLGLVIVVLVLGVVVAHPTSWAFSLEWLGKLLGLPAQVCAKAPRFVVADVLIWLAGALLLARIVLRGEWFRFKTIPLAAVVLVLLAVLSMVFAANKLVAVAKVVQWVEYFIVLYLLLVSVLVDIDRVKLVAGLWLVAASVVAIWGLVHYCEEQTRAPLDVSGPFLDRNIFSGYLAMILPLSWGMVLYSRKMMVWIEALALIGIGLVAMLAGGPWIAALIGMGIVSFVRSPRLFPVFAAAVLVLALSNWDSLPRDNARILAKSVSVFDEDLKTGETVPSAGVTEVARISPRYLHWQVAGKFLAPSFYRELAVPASAHAKQLLVGVGIGNYQQNIGQYYGSIPKANFNNDEPDTHNLYLVMAVSVGIPAVLAFLWLVGGFLRRAAAGFAATEDPWLKGLLLGAIGAMASLLVTNVFTETLVHGSGPAMMILFALVAASAGFSERKPSAS
jgi:hypothetical protein